MNIVLPLDASRACAWLLQDHIAITRAPMLDLTGEGDDDSFSSGTNDDEVGPNGTGGTRLCRKGGGLRRLQQPLDLGFSFMFSKFRSNYVSIPIT